MNGLSKIMNLPLAANNWGLTPQPSEATWGSDPNWLAVGGKFCSLAPLQTNHTSRRMAAASSQLGSDPFAPLLAFRNTPLAFGVRPQLFVALGTQI